jgi:hypothetical protein
MPRLGRPIPKNDWAREVGGRNGVSGLPAESPSEKKGIADAGPWEPVVQQIVEYQQLENDWDGFGAEAPSRELLASAIGLAYCYREQGVDPPQRVAPGVCGSVIFEWQDPDGTYAEVEIDRPLHAEIMVIEPGQPAKHWTIPTE